MLQKRLPLITEKYKIIFTHIPKAAGISIRTAIMGRELFDPGIPGHIPIRYFYKTFGNNIHTYFKFTFVRHPVARLFSAYSFLKKGGWTQRGFIDDRVFSEVFLSKFNSFEDFVEWLTPSRRFIYIHFYPQTYFICINKGKDKEILQDFVGRVESIEQDFYHLTKYLEQQGIRIPSRCLPKANVTTKGITPKISKNLLYKIYDLYKEDFDLLGYDLDFN